MTDHKRNPGPVMDRRRFMETGLILSGGLVLGGASECAGTTEPSWPPYNENRTTISWQVTPPTPVTPSLCCGFKEAPHSAGAALTMVSVVIAPDDSLAIEPFDEVTGPSVGGWQCGLALKVPNFVTRARKKGSLPFFGSSTSGGAVYASRNPKPGESAFLDFHLTNPNGGIFNYEIFKDYQVGKFPHNSFWILVGGFTAFLSDGKNASGYLQGSFTAPIGAF